MNITIGSRVEEGGVCGAGFGGCEKKYLILSFRAERGISPDLEIGKKKERFLAPLGMTKVTFFLELFGPRKASVIPIRRDRQRHGIPGKSRGHLRQRVPLHVEENAFERPLQFLPVLPVLDMKSKREIFRSNRGSL